QTKPEIAADIIDRGITMTGGGSLLRNIDLLLADETGLPVQVAENPLICVALGAGRTLEDPEFRGTLCAAYILRIVPSDRPTIIPYLRMLSLLCAVVPPGIGISHCSIDRLPFILKRNR